MARMEHKGQRQDGKFIHEKVKIQPEVESVTHSCSALTSRPSSPQEVNNPKNARKGSLSLRSKKLSPADYSRETKERILPCTGLLTKEQAPTKDDESCSLKVVPHEFEFSRRLIEIARTKQAERKRKIRRKSYRKLKTWKAVGCYQNHVTRRRKLSQSHLCSEEFTDFIGQGNVLLSQLYQSSDESADLIGSSDSCTDTEMVFQEQKEKDREMVHEYSRRLVALSTEKKRFQPHEHAHCCRCVQSFECFWPRSNLQTIRMQSL